VPVVVTGAGGRIGRVLVPMLAERGEVRAVVRRRAESEATRAPNVKVAVCDLAETYTLTSVMDGAHTVVHLAGGLDLPDEVAYEEANAGTVRDALEAAEGAEVTRFLLLSYPGASPDSTNPFLRAKGRAEETVRASGLEHVIVRSTHVYGPGQRWLEEIRAAASRPAAAVVLGPGTQRLAPVSVEDVARTLVAADDRANPVDGTFGLQGPDVVTADELTDLVARRRRRKVHLGSDAVRRASLALGRPVSPAELEVLAVDSLADRPSATSEFGVERTDLRSGLDASMSRTPG
jgi:uncharacterized protein YbjT (DUF2867 family)